MTKATKPATTITVDLNQLRTLLATVAPFAGDDGALPVIATVYLEGHAGFLTATATDRYAMGVSRAPVEGVAGFTALLKAKDARHILSTFKNRKMIQSKVTLTVADGSLTVSLADGLFADADDLTARYGLVDGTYPKVLEIFRKWKPAADTASKGCNPYYLAKFQHVTTGRGEPIRVSFGTGTSPILVQAGDYFLGAVMPVAFSADSAYNPMDLAGWLDGLGIAVDKPVAVAS